MIVVAIVGVLLPSIAILVATLWGWRHGTLFETAQDRYDWDFEQIVRRI